MDPIIENQTVMPEQKSPKNYKKYYLFIFAALLLFGAIYLAQAMRSNTLVGSAAKTAAQKLISSIPSEYLQMTIPFLRSQKYDSSLNEREQISSNGVYTSYLTSYDSDGNKINALLTIPQGEEPENGWPAIVFVHGYIPPTQYVTTEKYVDYIDYLARNRYVVFKIDLRGHGESEGVAGGGYYGTDYVTDALHAYSAMQNANFVNKDAVGMWGHSMAGNILLRSMAVKPEIPAAVVWAGAVYSYEDQRKYGISDNSYRPPATTTIVQNRRQQLFSKVGSPSASSQFWKQVAPTNYLNDLKGAIGIHHAVNDDVVNIGYSRDLIALLDRTDVPHEFFEYPTGGHNIDGASFTTAMARTVSFFDRYLKGGE